MRGQNSFVGRRCSDDKTVTHAATFSLINEDGARAVSRKSASQRAVPTVYQPLFLHFYIPVSARTRHMHARTSVRAYKL